MAQALANLAVGSRVRDPNTKYGGLAIVWRVAAVNHSGYPSGSVTLVADNILKLAAFDAKEPNNVVSGRKSSGNNRYGVSNIRQYLNSGAAAGQWYSAQHPYDAEPSSGNVAYNPYSTQAGFLNGFSSGFVSALLDTTLTTALPVQDGGGSETVTDKVFLPSRTEVLGTNNNGVAEGIQLPLFTTASNKYSVPTYVALQGNTYEEYAEDDYDMIYPYPNEFESWHWMTRSPYTNSVNSFYYISRDAFADYDSANYGVRGVRPACNVKADVAQVSDSASGGIYTLTFTEQEQKESPIWVKQNGIWVSGSAKCKQNGTWQNGTVREKQAGTWK